MDKKKPESYLVGFGFKINQSKVKNSSVIFLFLFFQLSFLFLIVVHAFQTDEQFFVPFGKGIA